MSNKCKLDSNIVYRVYNVNATTKQVIKEKKATLRKNNLRPSQVLTRACSNKLKHGVSTGNLNKSNNTLARNNQHFKNVHKTLCNRYLAYDINDNIIAIVKYIHQLKQVKNIAKVTYKEIYI